MKIKHNLLIMAILSMLCGAALFIGCSDDYPQNVESPNETILKSIKILNAGADGNTVVEGKIDENKKTVWFPRLDPETDVSAIRFEATVSDGAKLDKDAYAFDFEEGKDAKTIIVKVLNEPRFREYFVTLRLNVPVYGADFEKVEVYDHSGNDLGEPIYSTFVSNLTRGSGFDGENILIVTRSEPLSHILKVDDIKAGRVEPIKLNMTGVSGGIFPVNVGGKIKGHTYIANLSGAYGMKIYHWANPADEPEVIFNENVISIEGAGKRHGDNMSTNIDEKGNGYFYFGDNATTAILRLKVENFNKITEVKVLPSQPGVSFCMTMNRVENTDDYLLTGYDAPIMVTNGDAVVSYKMDATSVPKQGTDARIVPFNGERYLIVTEAPRYTGNAVLYIYDITQGGTTAEALKLFEEGEKKPLYQYSLGGSVNPAPGTQTGYYIVKDENGKDDVLRIYSASNNAGFVLLEIPKKKLDDE